MLTSMLGNLQNDIFMTDQNILTAVVYAWKSGPCAYAVSTLTISHFHKPFLSYEFSYHISYMLTQVAHNKRLFVSHTLSLTGNIPFSCRRGLVPEHPGGNGVICKPTHLLWIVWTMTRSFHSVNAFTWHSRKPDYLVSPTMIGFLRCMYTP